MTDPGLQALARRLHDLERRIAATERSARGQQTSISIAATTDDDAPIVELGLSEGVWTAYEASADAATALDKAAIAARTYNQDAAPTPAEQPDGVIPAGSLWTDTNDGNRQYRWEGSLTSGVWVQVPVGQGALDRQLLSLILMRFDTVAARDEAIPTPAQGMRAYVVETNLSYEYAGADWVPMVQYVRKSLDTSRTSTTLAPDPELQIDLVPGFYRIETFLSVSGGTDGDLRVTWAFSGTIASFGGRAVQGPAVSSTNQGDTTFRSTTHAVTAEVAYGTTPAGTDGAVTEDMLFRVTTPGTLSLVWAQNTASSSPTVVRFSSRVYVTKVN